MIGVVSHNMRAFDFNFLTRQEATRAAQTISRRRPSLGFCLTINQTREHHMLRVFPTNDVPCGSRCTCRIRQGDIPLISPVDISRGSTPRS